MSSEHYTKPLKAFTLLELLLSLAIAMSLLFFSMSFMGQTYRRNQLSLQENKMTAALRYARNYALFHHKTMTLVPLSQNDWSTGMVLFEDKTVRHQWRWHSSVRVAWRGGQAQDYIVFTPDVMHVMANGRFILTLASEKRCIVVNRIGRIKTEATCG